MASTTAAERFQIWLSTPIGTTHLKISTSKAALRGNGGTSIVAPELAGMFANMNAYLLTLGNNCLNEGGPCAPMGGLVNPMVYYLGAHPSYAPHYPFYDITQGCNNNDITTEFGLGYYCAGTGYDPVTGWGSVNALQLAWGFNAYRAGDFGAPVVTFSGPSTSTWYNTDQEVSWTIVDTSGLTNYAPNGVSGFTQGWDGIPTDPSSDANRNDSNSFFSGPEYPKGTSGCLDLTGSSCFGSVGQGWHYAYVQAWDNSGFSSTVAYGPIGYDTVSPVATANLSGTLVGSYYESAVKITISATDATSGVAYTKYSIDGSAFATYTGPLTVKYPGGHNVQFYSVDNAGNTEATQTVKFVVVTPTVTSLASSLNPSSYGQGINLTAKVTPTVGGTPTGTVTFKYGTVTINTATVNSSGVATIVTGGFAVGTHAVVAVYNPSSGNYLTSTSAVLDQTVNASPTTTTVTSSQNPSTVGHGVTFTATVKATFGSVPTGTVTFYKDGSQLNVGTLNSSGVASIITGSLTAGTHSIKAVYNASTDDATSSATLTQTVNQAAVATKTTLTSSLNPSTLGQGVTFTAKVTPVSGVVPTGTVTFYNGTGPINVGTLNSSGVATIVTGSLKVGTHSITAVYSGSASDLTSTSPVLSQVVNQ